jgi:glycosyltransferase involved in cell wall biosynthesis
MLKVGIYLRSTPEMGGTLQYNLAILSAAERLPTDRCRVVAAYLPGYWEEHIGEFRIDALPLGKVLLSRASAEFWGRLSLPVSLWRRMAPFWHPLTRKLMRQACDIWLFPSQDSMSYWLPVPALSTIHDLMHRYESRFSESGSPAQYRAREKIYSNMARWSSGVLVDSETGRRHVHDSYTTPMEKLYALPFVPPAYIYRTVTAADKTALRTKYGLPDSFFFYPAQFWTHKNHELLIRGLERNLAAIPDMHLVFCGGKKNNYDRIVSMAGNLLRDRNVTIIGYLPDDEMAPMYHCARALLMPTFYGPTNIPPLEAMVCGCPVAVSRIYGMPEQLGDAALYFDPLSVDEAADVMRRLWTEPDLRRDLGDRGRKLTGRWDLAAFSARLEDILLQLCGERQRG